MMRNRPSWLTASVLRSSSTAQRWTITPYRTLSTTDGGNGGKDGDGSVPTGRGRRRRPPAYIISKHSLTDGFFDLKSWPNNSKASDLNSLNSRTGEPVGEGKLPGAPSSTGRRTIPIEPISPFLEFKTDTQGKKALSMNMDLYHQFMDSLSRTVPCYLQFIIYCIGMCRKQQEKASSVSKGRFVPGACGDAARVHGNPRSHADQHQPTYRTFLHLIFAKFDII